MQGNYQSFENMSGEERAGSWRNFFAILSGTTGGAHLKIVYNLRRAGHKEVQSPEEADYLLVFCPVITRVGTDIGEALEQIPAQKPAVLVVMHQTFNPNRVVADSRRQVNNPDVCLTVDCLFYEGKLLKCSRNDIAWGEIRKLLNIPIPEVPTGWTLKKCLKDHPKLFILLIVVLLVIVIFAIVFSRYHTKRAQGFKNSLALNSSDQLFSPPF